MGHKTIRTGDTVNYHSFVGGKIYSSGHVVREIFQTDGGVVVAFITGKEHYVALAALSKETAE